ncbi:hypothetical protein [Sporolactobacillus laevolacticus]|uniref:Uncharacterized protein n=1 Tax=Sporolactobacillus laevolacticus DSM 442 TaxID=1395513 RepID=V6IUK6_9BACL|nr:hypothetical protein [Sporolactobacillus laevolacticus]EST10697.1 hypothetical protein P343_15965 [Sporolactobacillus laevolacticus DSM 442]
MNELLNHCKNILNVIDENYPNQKNYTGAIRNIYITISQLLQDVEADHLPMKQIDFTSLSRQFVDETTHYSSSVLQELEIVRKILGDL